MFQCSGFYVILLNIFLYKTIYFKVIHNLLNFLETFLVDKLSNGANPESRRCVVLAVALMKKKKKKEED